MNTLRFVTGAGLLSLVVAVGGCQRADSGSVLDLGRTKANENQEGMVRESELRAYCPRVVLREGTATYRSYEKKGVQEASSLVFQASVSDVTRSCTYQPGTITVNVALAGKVVPGPKATTGTVTMPIRVVAINGGEVIYSQLHNFQVTLDRNSGATQFIFNDPAVVVPQGASSTLQIQAGFDEGPVKQAE